RLWANERVVLAGAVAYGLVVLHCEAVAGVPEVAKGEVNTVRQKLWKVGAIVKASVRRIWFHFSATWPQRHLFVQVSQAVASFVAKLRGEEASVLPGAALLPLK